MQSVGKGAIFDGVDGFDGGYLEIKGGCSELGLTCQLRLQTHKAIMDEKPFIIQTMRPVNSEFQEWLDFCGVQVTNSQK